MEDKRLRKCAISGGSATGSSVRPVVGSVVATIVGCSATSEGAPWAPTSARPAVGMGATMDSACPAGSVVTLALLPPKTGAAPADGYRLA